MVSDAQSRRRRFRYSLRLLLIGVIIASIFFAWIGAQLSWIAERRAALQWIQPLHARQIAASQGNPLPPTKGFYVADGGVDAPWTLAVFGEHGVERIELDQGWLTSDAQYSVDKIQSLFPEAEITASTSTDDSRQRTVERFVRDSSQGR